MNISSGLTAAEVKKAAFEFGADLVGIGSIDRWKDAPEDQDPKAIMPRAKSVICVGFRIHRGTLRGAEEGTYFSSYTLNSFEYVNNVFAPMVQRRMSSLLEDYGYEAVPVMYYSHNLGRGLGKPAKRPDGTDKPSPEIFFNFRIAGVLCGVGEIGHSRMLLTPEFGPAQRVYFILTEAELEPDPIISGICDHCLQCVNTCPANALEYRTHDNIEIPGVVPTIRRSAIDDLKCRLAHISGALSPYAPDDLKPYIQNIINGSATETEDGSPRPDIDELWEKVTSKVPYAAHAQELFHSPSALCAQGCVRSCLAHLEKVGRLTRKFHHPFR